MSLQTLISELIIPKSNINPEIRAKITKNPKFKKNFEKIAKFLRLKIEYFKTNKYSPDDIEIAKNQLTERINSSFTDDTEMIIAKEMLTEIIGNELMERLGNLIVTLGKTLISLSEKSKA